MRQKELDRRYWENVAWIFAAILVILFLSNIRV